MRLAKIENKFYADKRKIARKNDKITEGYI
jgi:hypothetical protein